MPENPPLSDAQIAFFAEQNRLAAERASKRTIRQALVGYLILGLGVLGMYLNGQSVSSTERAAVVDSGTAAVVAGCNRDFNGTQRLRSLLEHADDAVTAQQKAGKVTAAQAADAHDFYAAELAKIPLPDCRKAQFVLTDDPEKPIVIPTPLHP